MSCACRTAISRAELALQLLVSACDAHAQVMAGLARHAHTTHLPAVRQRCANLLLPHGGAALPLLLRCDSRRHWQRCPQPCKQALQLCLLRCQHCAVRRCCVGGSSSTATRSVATNVA